MSGAAVKVYSLADDRTNTLFPEYCGDDGSVCGFTTDNMRQESRDGFQSLVLDCVAMRFRRLGPDSRNLVMSLYRAIIERAYIMRMRGTCTTRPEYMEFCICGFSDVTFPDLIGGVCDDLTVPGKRRCDLAGRNRRRAFGDVFRGAVVGVVDMWHGFGTHGYTPGYLRRDCVRYFPPTPFVCGVSAIGQFMPCSKDMGDTTLFDWDQTCVWTKFFRSYSGGSCDTVPWLLDQSAQCSFTMCESRQRPLAKAFLGEYCRMEFPCASQFEDRVHCYISKAGQPVERLESYRSSYFGSVACAVDGIMPEGRPDWRFHLPSLALALRILSVWNAQTVMRCTDIRIPHIKLDAVRTVPLGFDECHNLEVGDEEVQISLETVYYGCAIVRGSKSYTPGFATFGNAGGDVYYNPLDRVIGGEDNPDIIKPGCWMEWEKDLEVSGDSHCSAGVSFSAVWPKYNAGVGTTDKFVCFVDNSAYPVRWAVKENDVAFGAVSTFVKDSCGHKAWVANRKTGGDVASALGDCVDLMTVLARQAVQAGIRRLTTDAIPTFSCEPDTFGALNFPITRSAICTEMVAQVPDIEALKDKASRLNGDIGIVPLYDCVCIRHCARDTIKWIGHTAGGEREVVFKLISGNRWYNLASTTCRTGSIDFRYDQQDCGGTMSTTRHAWRLPERSVQFGGFFGSFIFNNRSVRQKP